MFSKISHIEISRITENFLRPAKRMFVYGVPKNTLENRRKAARDFVNAFNALISSQKEILIDSLENEFLYEPFDSKVKLSPKFFKSLTGDREFKHPITGNIVLGFKLNNFTMNSGVCADETLFIPEVDFCLDKVYLAMETGDYIELENISNSLNELSEHSALDMEGAYRALKGNGIQVKVCSNLDVSKFFNGEGKEILDAFREYLIMTSYKALKYYAEKETQYDTIGPAGRFAKGFSELKMNKSLEIHAIRPKIVKNDGKNVFIRIPTANEDLGDITINMGIVDFLACFMKPTLDGKPREKVVCKREIKGYKLDIIFTDCPASIGSLDFTKLQSIFDNRMSFKNFSLFETPYRRVLIPDDPVKDLKVVKYLGVVTLRDNFLFNSKRKRKEEILWELLPEYGVNFFINGKFITKLGKEYFDIREKAENYNGFISYDLYLTIDDKLWRTLSEEKKVSLKSSAIDVVVGIDDSRDYVDGSLDLTIGTSISYLKEIYFK